MSAAGWPTSVQPMMGGLKVSSCITNHSRELQCVSRYDWHAPTFATRHRYHVACYVPQPPCPVVCYAVASLPRFSPPLTPPSPTRHCLFRLFPFAVSPQHSWQCHSSPPRHQCPQPPLFRPRGPAEPRTGRHKPWTKPWTSPGGFWGRHWAQHWHRRTRRGPCLACWSCDQEFGCPQAAADAGRGRGSAGGTSGLSWGPSNSSSVQCMFWRCRVLCARLLYWKAFSLHSCKLHIGTTVWFIHCGTGSGFEFFEAFCGGPLPYF